MKRILFTAQDLEQKNLRGIGFYAKSLLRATTELGFQNQLLTSAANTKNAFLQEMIILKRLIEPTGVSQNRLLFEYLKDCLKYKSAKDVKLGLITNYESKLLYLQNCNSIVNKPLIYDFIGANSRLNIPYKLKSESDFIFTTSPLFIKSTKPVIQTVHDIIPILNLDTPATDNSTIFYKRFKGAMDHCDKIVCVSEFSKQETLKVFPNLESKFHVTYQPAPIFDSELELINKTPEIEEFVLQKYGLEKQSYFFYTGFLEKRKNIVTLINAYLQSIDKTKKSLVLAGEIDNDNSIHELIAQNNIFNKSKKIKFKPGLRYVGFITNIEKLILMKNACAFVFPTRYEGFGIPPLEAMSMECPVISSNVTSLPEVCGEAAILVNPYKVNEIADSMIEIASNEALRNSLIEKGKVQIQKFSNEKYKEKLIKVLN